MEDPSSPGNHPAVEAVSSTNGAVVNKPIKKKTLAYAVEDGSSSDTPDEGPGPSAPFSPSSMREMEGKAKRELIQFLENKQIDPKYAEVYQIHIRLQKKRNSSSGGDHGRKSDGPGYSVTYSSPDGSILTSKTDVLNAISESKKRTSISQSKSGAVSGVHYASKRSDAHAQAKAALQEVLPTLPVDIDGITVLSFGRLDARSGFETLVQLYPVGYKCEQTITGVNFFKGAVKQRVVCEVGEIDGYPEFRITVKANGDTFLASTEAAAWKKFNPANIESDWQPSFFNLQVELLIEGMQGAEMCDTYRFHAERGYGSQYFSQDEAVTAKNAFLAKSGREKRNLERQKARLLTKEEMDRLQELENKRLADEKELAKKLQLVEKERKDLEREGAKRAKQEQKAIEQQRREEERLEEQRRKEASKTVEKAQREMTKKSEKFRAQFKKEINTELKKNRAEANSALLQYFDEEEEVAEQLELSGAKNPTTAVASTSGTGMQEFLAAVGDATIADLLSSTGTEVSSSAAQVSTSWDDVIQLTNTLHLFKRHLNIETPIKLDSIVQSLELVSKAGALRSKEGQAAADIESAAMDVAEPAAAPAPAPVESDTRMKTESEDDEAEFEEKGHTNEDGARTTHADNTQIASSTTAAVPAVLSEEAKLAQAEAELDRIQLKLMKHLLHELKDILDIDDPSAAEGAADTTKSTKTAASKASMRLPLNQLTWAELARMAILNYLYQEQSHGRENIQHVLRGAKAPHFKLAKNVVRNIRYRLAVRSKQPVVSTDGTVSTSTNSAGHQHGVVTTKQGQVVEFVGAQASPENRLASIAALKAETAKNKTASGLDSLTLSECQKKVHYQNAQFSTEKEILQALEQVCTGDNAATYSETYKRCSKVLIRLLNMAQARNFVWEVDASAYPDYYTTIRRPVMYTGIAACLVNREYSVATEGSGVAEDALVSALFAADVLQVPTNCITYNSEVTPVVAQAQKMLHATHRLLASWIHSPSRPPLTMLSENFCLLTQEYIVATDSLKCGKCAGIFCYSAVDDACSENSLAPGQNKAGAAYSSFYIAPTKEIVEQQNEEWVCPLCLSEDPQLLHQHLSAASLEEMYRSPFSIDEWGFSNKMPWILHGDYSTMPESINEQFPYLTPFVNALRVLSDSRCTPVLPVNREGAANSTVIISAGARNSRHNNTQWSFRKAVTELPSWTFAERVTVLQALCAVFRTSDKSMDFMQSINADCEKLVKIAAKPNFREADFMSVVKDLMGEEGVVQCRSLLDGMDGQSDSYLQQIISEGRCVVCNHSTFEDDMQAAAKGNNPDEEGETKEDEVILCDGCNAEVHLRCLNLTAVPTSEWHCNLCKERIALRESKHSSLNQFEGSSSIEKHRNRAEEDALLTSCVDRRISSATSSGRSKAEKADKEAAQSGSSASLSAMEPAPGEDKCTYCGMGELELCSPFVVGQSRAEHDAVLQLAGQKPTADGFLGNATGTTVHFLIQGKAMSAPTVEFPFFPPVKSPKGEKLVQAYRESHCTPIIAHQLCALQIFQARITRSRHTMRRRNKVVGQRAVSMTGISVLPLGYDDCGREYWKFPVSEDLFVCSEHLSDDAQRAFQEQLLLDRAELRAEQDEELRQQEAEVGLSADSKMDVDSDADSDDDILKSRSGSFAVPASLVASSTALQCVECKPTGPKSAERAGKKANGQPDRKWKRLSDVTDIRRVVELLGTSETEQALRKSIINALLLERSAPASTTTALAAASTDSTADVKSEAGAEDNKSATSAAASTANPNAGTLNSWLDRSRSSNNNLGGENAAAQGASNGNGSEQDLKSLVKKPAVDIVPAAMRLMTSKGQDIMPTYVIQQEAVFEEDGGASDNEDEQDEDVSHSEYFTFHKGRKYFAIALVNKEGSVLKMGGTAKVQGLTVVYQIHREGIAAPLSYAPLTEAWTDHMYYFATVTFKKSGRYTLSFITEGENAASIKPLIYPVVVEARTVRCGIPHALDKMIGAQYLEAVGRQILLNRREVINSLELVYNEVDGVRAALLMLYLALPAGALTQDASVDGAAAARGDTFALITEPAGWNDMLDQAWRGAVYEATTPVQIMECVLLLEHYINKQWLSYPQSRLIGALPNPHFAVCCATYSAAALRVYCLDKALIYDKVYNAPRERRSVGQFSAYEYEEPVAATNNAAGRAKRTAAANATARIRSTVNYNEDSDEGEPAHSHGGAGSGGVVLPAAPQKWSCGECTVSNEARARSCSSCGARKPVGGAPVAVDNRRNSRDSSRTSDRRSSRESRTRAVLRDSDEEPEDESSDGDSDGESGEENSLEDDDADSDAGNQARARKSSRETAAAAAAERKSSRSRKSVDYFVESDNEDEEEEVVRANKRRRGSSVAEEAPHKRTKELTDEEYFAQYKEQIPDLVAEFDEEIADLAAGLTEDGMVNEDVDFQMRCLSILRVLIADERTEPFWAPVDLKMVPSYKHYISHPMDLGTIHENVRSNAYDSNVESFAKDVRLVWSNCKTFNLEYSILHNNATVLNNKFEELLDAWMVSADKPVDPDLKQ